MESPGKVRDARASAGMQTAEVDNDQVGLRMCSEREIKPRDINFFEVKRLCLSSLAREGAGRGARAIWTGSVCGACPQEYIRM